MKYIPIALLAIIISFCAVLYTSCEKDKCSGVTCHNGGTCVGGDCNCPTAWSRPYCDSSAFAGTWNGSEISTQSNPPGNLGNVTCTLTISPSDPTTVFFYNYDNLGATISGKLGASKTIILFASQKIPYGAGSITIINGSITLINNKTAEFSFDETEAGLVWSNSGRYNKK